mmetsp:Transcript_31591/g.75360  ORF Transcript_31591/g.75360 Transcript_31591/m.75360 type:complete len:299 (+) Transcript_31591:358-1254(+)
MQVGRIQIGVLQTLSADQSGAVLALEVVRVEAVAAVFAFSLENLQDVAGHTKLKPSSASLALPAVVEESPSWLVCIRQMQAAVVAAHLLHLGDPAHSHGITCPSQQLFHGSWLVSLLATETHLVGLPHLAAEDHVAQAAFVLHLMPQGPGGRPAGAVLWCLDIEKMLVEHVRICSQDAQPALRLLHDFVKPAGRPCLQPMSPALALASVLRAGGTRCHSNLRQDVRLGQGSILCFSREGVGVDDVQVAEPGQRGALWVLLEEVQAQRSRRCLGRLLHGVGRILLGSPRVALLFLLGVG